MVKTAVKSPKFMFVATMTFNLLWITIIKALGLPISRNSPFTLEFSVALKQMLKSQMLA
jgi:hypothetical protein